ncbi:hypothetical protein SAMN02745857_02800 [Andreprevotia lacus DSM 23236]|jgi:hypothetical protein|uniref:Uncharacterized protein n=1 Tax=Andreprevotia lacus DSM 23236 TaxID=1121001 RepID=A0A1W1XTL7_9NEIS|nr:hypothetical protein [Andreprevotia lacus]SMC27303.1 hypothetical protein SAMN02745857_02800 [Andreprevotia lacus DSM 23236]
MNDSTTSTAHPAAPLDLQLLHLHSTLLQRAVANGAGAYALIAITDLPTDDQTGADPAQHAEALICNDMQTPTHRRALGLALLRSGLACLEQDVEQGLKRLGVG